MTGAFSRRALLGAALALPGCALQPTLEGAPPVALPNTRQIDVAADGPHGHVRHRIMLAVPPTPAPPQGWPVLYVLDGDLLFALTAQLMRNRFARGPGVPAQGAVVVGLGYAGDQVLDLDARTYDYTPPAPGPSADGRGRREGGADAFLNFVDTAVRPLVEQAAPVDTARQTFFGHSYGGLCVLHALFTRPGGFRNYVAASPAVWWRSGFLLQEQSAFVAQRHANAPPLSLLVTRGEREVEPLKGAAHAAMQRQSGEYLRVLLDGLHEVPGLDVRFASLAGADHGSSMAPAVQQALSLAIGMEGRRG